MLAASMQQFTFTVPIEQPNDESEEDGDKIKHSKLRVHGKKFSGAKIFDLVIL